MCIRIQVTCSSALKSTVSSSSRSVISYDKHITGRAHVHPFAHIHTPGVPCSMRLERPSSASADARSCISTSSSLETPSSRAFACSRLRSTVCGTGDNHHRQRYNRMCAGREYAGRGIRSIQQTPSPQPLIVTNCRMVNKGIA